MSGQQGNYQQRGVTPRALAHIFQEIDSRVEKIFAIRVSYLEIYNEQLYDLLSDTPATADHLQCLDDNGNVIVKGLTQKLVRRLVWTRCLANPAGHYEFTLAMGGNQ